MKTRWIGAAILAVGVALAGLFVSSGIKEIAARDRVVSVRGLAEQEVRANHVVWPITYKTTGNDLQSIYAEVNATNAKIVKFLKDNGLTDTDISLNSPEIEDLQTDRWTDKSKITSRYNVKSTVTVASDKVDIVRQLVNRMGELLKVGVAIPPADYGEGIKYEYTELNKIKPEMIKAATIDARAAAQKFADDSESELGKIKEATQGYFEIEDRDEYTPYVKTVRVVTNVVFFLKS